MVDLCFGPSSESLCFLAFGFGLGGLSFKAEIWPKLFSWKIVLKSDFPAASPSGVAKGDNTYKEYYLVGTLTTNGVGIASMQLQYMANAALMQHQCSA